MAADLAARSAGAKLVAADSRGVVVLAGSLALPPRGGRGAGSRRSGPGEWLSESPGAKAPGDAVAPCSPSLNVPGFRLSPGSSRCSTAASRRVLVGRSPPSAWAGRRSPRRQTTRLGAQADRPSAACSTRSTPGRWSGGGPVPEGSRPRSASRTAGRISCGPSSSIEGGVAEEAMTPGARRAISSAPLLKLLGGQRLDRGRVRRTLAQRSRDAAWGDSGGRGRVPAAGADFDVILCAPTA